MVWWHREFCSDAGLKPLGFFPWLLAKFATSLIVLTTHGAVLWTFCRTWKNNPLPLFFFFPRHLGGGLGVFWGFFKADKLCTVSFCKRQKTGSKCTIRPKPKLRSSILKSQRAFSSETDTHNMASTISYAISLNKWDDSGRLYRDSQISADRYQYLRKHTSESKHRHTPKESMSSTLANKHCPTFSPQKLQGLGFSISCCPLKEEGK